MEYQLVARYTEWELVEDVRDYIKDGWEPLGGAVILPQTKEREYKFYQTIIRRSTDAKGN